MATTAATMQRAQKGKTGQRVSGNGDPAGGTIEAAIMPIEAMLDTAPINIMAADLNLVTSESESFCLSILEAMCFGCPSVAMRVGGIPEVIDDNRSGQLVPFGEAAGFARTVEALMGDTQRRLEFGRAGRAIAQERFSAEMIVPKYESLYYRICPATKNGG